MKESEWGRLACLQDQIAKTEDLRHRQRQNYHKLLYKNDLQKMIQDRKAQAKTIEERDRLFYNELYKSVNSHHQSSAEQQKFDKLLKQSAQENYSAGKDKKRRLKSEIEEEKLLLTDKYKKVATELEEEREKQWQEREQHKKQLASYYEEQIHGVDSKKHLQRLQNQKFEQIAAELEQRKDQERINHINKIRFGYLQNPEAFSLVKEIYKQKNEQKQWFLNKMENSRLQDNPERIRQKKHFETIEVSRFNKNNFLEKQMKRKQHHKRELEDQNNKLLNIQKQLSEEQERIRLRKMEERNSLKNELEHQISEHEEGKIMWKRMSENESRINQEVLSHKKSLIPGLSKDYKDRKQEVILDSFLRVPKNQSLTSERV